MVTPKKQKNRNNPEAATAGNTIPIYLFWYLMII